MAPASRLLLFPCPPKWAWLTPGPSQRGLAPRQPAEPISDKTCCGTTQGINLNLGLVHHHSVIVLAPDWGTRYKTHCVQTIFDCGSSENFCWHFSFLWNHLDFSHIPFHFLFMFPSSASFHLLGELRIPHLHKRPQSQQCLMKDCALRLVWVSPLGEWRVWGASCRSIGSTSNFQSTLSQTHILTQHIHIDTWNIS